MATQDSQSPAPSPSSSRSNRPSLGEALRTPQGIVLLVLALVGLAVFGVLLAEALAGFSAAEIVADRLFVIWPTVVGIGLWGWMLVERSFVRADPTLEIVLRRAGVLGLGIFLCRDLDPGVILAAMAGYAICGVRTRFLLALAALAALIFPVLQGWLQPDGWLGKIGVRDFAGDTLHILTGMIGVVVLTGSRWSNREPLPLEKMRRQKAFSAIFGFLLIQLTFAGMFGREAFPNPETMRTVLANGAAAAVCGGIVAGLFASRVPFRPRLHLTLFGCMAGWVVTAAGVDHYAIWQAALFGALAVPVMVLVLGFLDTLELRDPFALVPIHFACGALGMLLAPFGAQSDARFVMQFVAVVSIAMPALVIGCLIVLPFVKLKLLSKHDPAAAKAKPNPSPSAATN